MERICQTQKKIEFMCTLENKEGPSGVTKECMAEGSISRFMSSASSISLDKMAKLLTTVED